MFWWTKKPSHQVSSSHLSSQQQISSLTPVIITRRTVCDVRLPLDKWFALVVWTNRTLCLSWFKRLTSTKCTDDEHWGENMENQRETNHTSTDRVLWLIDCTPLHSSSSITCPSDYPSVYVMGSIADTYRSVPTIWQRSSGSPNHSRQSGRRSVQRQPSISQRASYIWFEDVSVNGSQTVRHTKLPPFRFSQTFFI